LPRVVASLGQGFVIAVVLLARVSVRFRNSKDKVPYLRASFDLPPCLCPLVLPSLLAAGVRMGAFTRMLGAVSESGDNL